MENVLFPSLYEEDFIIRSLGSIVTQPDVALTELVANAWAHPINQGENSLIL